MLSVTPSLYRYELRSIYLCLALLYLCSIGQPAYSVTSEIGLGGTWSEYDPKFFGAGVQTLSNHSSAGFTSTHSGSVSQLQDRPRVYQEFEGLDVSEVGQKVTATFDLQFHTVPDMDDTIFRFGFGDRTTNQGLVPLMVDLGQTAGDRDNLSASMRMRYDDSLTDETTTFSEGDYSGFLSASGTFGDRHGNPTSPDDSDGPGGIRDTVATHTFTATIERVERNVDTSFPEDGIADEVVGGWYVAVTWTSDEPGAETLLVDSGNPNGFSVFDVDTGLSVYQEDLFNSNGRINNIDTLGFMIYVDDPFSSNSSIGGYSVSNFVLEYEDGTNLEGDYNGDGVVDAADYTLWRDTLGSTGDLTADGSENEVVDQADYALWQMNYGNTRGGSLLARGVPEPGVLTLTWLSGSLFAFCSERRSLVISRQV